MGLTPWPEMAMFNTGFRFQVFRKACDLVKIMKIIGSTGFPTCAVWIGAYDQI
jgi:hypothetical protein